MITAKNITGIAVLPITTAGQSGSAWLDEDHDGAEGRTDVRIYHTDTGTPSIATVRTLGKRLFAPSSNMDVLIMSADSGNDIYYAVCHNDNDKAIALVDVV